MPRGEELRKDANDAFMRARRYHGELDEIYRYFMPFRQTQVRQAPTGQGGRDEGQQRTDELFDGTGLSSAFTFAGTLQADWMPPGQDFFELKSGPLIPDGDPKKAMDEALGKVRAIVHSVLAQQRAYATVHEMCLDLFAGTGALLVNPGDDRELIRSRAIPLSEIALDVGPWGDVWHVWWRRKYQARYIEEMWRKPTISDKLAKRIKDQPREGVELTQYTHWDTSENVWKLIVQAEGDEPDAIIHQEEMRSNPWVLPRFFVVPGETFGRGLAHLGLPFVKTANKTRELELTAAAMAIMGIFTVRNDGVFNPDNATFSPLATWNVAYNGGPLGPTVQRLPVPQDFDISTIVMKDEREQIKKVLFDDELPETEAAVRSATEIAGRLRRHAKRYGGTAARLSQEWIIPYVQRSIDILEQKGLFRQALGAQTSIKVDQLTTSIEVVSPIAASLRADRVERVTQWMQIIVSLLGPQAPMMVSKIEELVPQMARWMGVEEKFIRSKADIEKIKAQIAQVAQAQAAAQAPPPAEAQADPGATYVNGRAM